MEGKNTQKLISVFEIPIESYEIDMQKESSKEKKTEILDLFKNHNQLKSKSEFEEIESELHYACKKGDLDLIKILLSEKIQDATNNLTFKIDKTNHTASLFKINKNLENLIIPRMVKHEMKDYLVTSITGLSGSLSNRSIIKNIKFEENSSVSTIYEHAFSFSKIEEIFIPPSLTKICENALAGCSNLRKVEIPTNSNLQTIESFAFFGSNIEEIYFPKSLTELKEGWCSETRNLKKIIISPSNEHFIFKDDQYLLCKSDTNKDEFDTLLFVRRDIEEISIPSNVIKICEHTFSCCSNLRKVEIPTNSNLQTIERNAFLNSTIEEIFIPSSLTKICENAFYDCFNLRKVEIPTNSNLQTIERNAFSYSIIEEISIPSSVTKICDHTFSYCSNLRKVEIPTNSNLQTIESYAFSDSTIEEIFIPSNLTKICENAFYRCYKFQIIEISEESKLQSIPESAFKECSKLIIMIPISLEKLIQTINST